MTRRDRFRHWLAEKILGEHTNEEICFCQWTGPFSVPDYYVDGMAVYDMEKRIAMLDPDTTQFRDMIDKVKRS